GLDEQTRLAMHRLCQALGTQDQVALHGFASEVDLPVLLSGASALLYPSLSEGFGLPILEAFSVATPVLTSDTTSLPEVAGDAAELVPPGIATALASAITRLMKDPMRRGELVARGAQQVGRFRWAEAAERYAAVFDVASRSRRRRSRGREARSAA
ncbi:MAG: glycosyltransferase, partial [Phycisphaeraceae bacterium]